ncbi:MAG: hypothetical protein CVU50_10645 [Candidatus Cloacimonetes bacterium HGW-Cloacimonetes-3]|jgi:hypothetical protein|nr:MAG: hypothetical protein CVU50_10645 [Candidatus Cloacimonetes bacterium HGW-Cloacimonetes-3]
MKKALIVLSVVLLLALALLSTDEAKPDSIKGRITGFTAQDMPNDDGAGIILKWKPLDKSHRIIKYNIYRGVSPDSLFLISSMEVDPKMGVLAPDLFYYDRGDQPFIEFENAPSKIKKEKQQNANSPLYRKFPRDPQLLGSLIGRFNIIGGIKNNKLYKKAVPLKHEDDILTGIKLYQFEYIFANPIPGQDYYYTVMGVNERGNSLPYAEIQQVRPEDNPPDDKTILSSTYVRDTGMINFEWIPSVSNPDIDMWEGWLIRRSTIAESGNILPENWQQTALQLFQLPNYYGPGTLYYQVDTKAEGIPLPADMDAYTPVISYSDYSGQTAAIPAKSHRVINASELPTMPSFSIVDKKNDKGDNLVVSIGKPVAYMVSASYTNHAKKALRVNYEIAANEHYKINKLHFSFLSPDGTKIGDKNEFFIDKSLVFKLPKEYVGLTEMRMQISMETVGSKTFETVFTEQKVVYDPINKLFKGEKLFLGGEPVSEQYIDVLTRNAFEPDFMFGNRTNAISRAYDHSIPYEDVLYQRIIGYDASSKQLTMDPQIQVAALADSGYSLSVPLFRDKFNKDLLAQQDEIAKLKTVIATFPQGAAPDSLTDQLQYVEGNYNYITSNPVFLEAQKAKSDKQWLKTMLKAHYANSRTYSYQLLKTDGNGALVITDTYKDDSGNSTFFPSSEWIDSTKIMTFIATLLFCGLIVYAIYHTRRKEVYIRPIAGLHEIDNAIGRATEMGRPIMFVPGWGSLGDVCTIASMMILSQIAKKAAEFDIRIISPHCDYLVLPMAQEIVQSAFSEVGRSDAFDQNDIFYVSGDQFPFCAGVNGITVRERVATVFYMGYFNAEALLLTETGNQAGAIQIAATDAITQIPFFITTCDYTLIGEEFYAASAYLSRNPELVSMLKAQDYFKLIMVIVMVIGTVLSTLHITTYINAFPVE